MNGKTSEAFHMTAAEQNMFQYLEDNYSGWEVTEAFEDALENDRDLFLDHLCELIREDRNGCN